MPAQEAPKALFTRTAGAIGNDHASLSVFWYLSDAQNEITSELFHEISSLIFDRLLESKWWLQAKSFKFNFCKKFDLLPFLDFNKNFQSFQSIVPLSNPDKKLLFCFW